MPAPAHLIVGRVRRAHGIRGELVVESLTNDAAAHFAVGRTLLVGSPTGDLLPANDPTPHTVTVRRAVPFKNGWILRLAEIPDRTTAEQWRDRFLFVAMPEVSAPTADEVFYHDLIGMTVEHLDGRVAGQVIGLYELPQGVLLEVQTPAGSAMVPYHPPLVVSTDLARHVVVVDPPPGLLDSPEVGDTD